MGGLSVVLLFSPYFFLCIEIGLGRLSLSKIRQNCYSKHLSMALCPGISIQFLNLSKSRHATRQIEISSGTLSKKSTEKFLVKFWLSKIIFNSHAGALSMWRPLAVKAIFPEIVLMNRLHVFPLLTSISFSHLLLKSWFMKKILALKTGQSSSYQAYWRSF